MAQPTTQFADNDGVNIAFQTLGEGPDVVFVPGFCSHLDLMWGDPAYTRFIRRLSSFCRLTRYDKRSTGLSDRFARPTSLDEALTDLRAVVAASGAQRPTVLGFSEGGALACAYAATYPDEVASLVLCEAFPRGRTGPGYLEERHEDMALLTKRSLELADSWGEGRLMEFFGPSMVGGSVHRRLVGMFERASASPTTIRAVFEAALELDVTAVLKNVRVPTLVLHRRDDIIPIEAGRYIAEHIEGATFVELEGADHMPWAGDYVSVVTAIERFVGAPPSPLDDDRALSTVVMVSMVGADERAAASGDAAFAQLTAELVDLFRTELQALGGQEVRAAGDSYVATFAGPASAARFGLGAVTASSLVGVEVRVGVHSGEVRTIAGEPGGIAFHAAARVASAAEPGSVFVSSTVRDLTAGSGLRFASRGMHGLKGLDGSWELFAVTGDEALTRLPVDPLDGFTRGERALLQMSARSHVQARAFSRVLRVLP